MQKVCETLARVAESEMVMLIKSDVQNTDTSGDIRPASLFALTLYRISIGRVRPEAVVLNNASLHLRYLKVKCFDLKFTIFLNNMYERTVFVRVVVVW